MALIPSAAPARARLRDVRDLQDHMDFHGLNVRELSELCGSLRHRSTIGHLHSGARSTCSIHLAKRIEKILRQPPGALFTPVPRSDMVVITPASTSRKKVAA